MKNYTAWKKLIDERNHLFSLCFVCIDSDSLHVAVCALKYFCVEVFLLFCLLLLFELTWAYSSSEVLLWYLSAVHGPRHSLFVLPLGCWINTLVCDFISLPKPVWSSHKFVCKYDDGNATFTHNFWEVTWSPNKRDKLGTLLQTFIKKIHDDYSTPFVAFCVKVICII